MRARVTLLVVVLLVAAPPAANAVRYLPMTPVQAQRAVEQFEAQTSDATHWSVDQCRVGQRRAKCRLREWGTTDQLPWVDGPVTDYEAEFTAVVRRVNGRLVVHLPGLCLADDRSPGCSY